MRAINGGAGETRAFWYMPMRRTLVLMTDFSVTVVSDAFKGVSSIQRHRKVNNLLQAEFALPHGEGLHALSLKTKTPEEWAKENPS